MQLEDIKKELEKGNDTLIRELYANKIEKVLIASAQGKIGWGEFIQYIKTLLNGMENICNKHWKD